MSVEPRRFLLSSDSLVDVFQSLDRDKLDVLQLTCMCFHNVIAKYEPHSCLRRLSIDLARFERFDGRCENSNLPPEFRRMKQANSDPDSATFCLKIELSEARRTSFFESNKLDELLAKCDEKMPKATYVEDLRLYYAPEFLMRIGLAHRELAARTLIGRAHIEGFCCTSTIDMRELMDNIHDASFRAINSLTVEVYALQIVDGRFLQHCREMGILSLGLYSGDYENRVTIDDMLDYCFSPSRNGLETTDRILSSSFFFDKAFFQHLLQAAEAQEELNYGIILTWDFADGDLSDHVIELEEEITKHYKSHGPFEIKMDLNDTVRVTALPCRCYAVRLDNGTGIVWRLDCENNRITVGVLSITSIQNPLLCMSPFSYKRDDTRRPFQVFMG